MLYYSIIGLCLFGRVHADLPVHCLRHQVVGDWEFTLGPTSSTRSPCGHQKPDNPDNQPSLDFVLNQGQTTKQRISLQDPNTATKDDGSSGTFTMIYDEGFEVAFPDTTFFAFSMFKFVGEGSNRHNVSKCHETQVGWYHDPTRSNWGCYFGKKVNAKSDSGEQDAPRRKRNALFSSSLDTDYAPTTDSNSINQVDAAMDSAFGQSPQSSNDQSNLVSKADPLDGPQAAGSNQDAPSASFTFQSANALADSNKQDSLSLVGDQDTTLWSAPLPAPAPSPPPPPARQEQQLPMINSLDGDSWTWPAPVKKPEESLAATDSFTAPAPADNTLTGEPLSLAIEDVPASYKPWVPSDDKQARTGYDQPLTPEWHQSVVDGLNFLQLGWKAVHYKVYDHMTARQMNKFAGIRRKVPKAERVALTQAPAFLGVSTRTRRVKTGDYDDDSAPPDSFDWRNKDGQNFLDSVITQGDCGSCYTISTVRMLSARNKIRQNNPNAASFSISFPLYCSEYNQGCDGGYGFLQSKWSEDVGLIPESCAPYQQSGRCSVSNCDLGAKRYRASNHRYVGGYYGASDEDSIKHEVMNGPLVMSFEPKEDFMYYKGGVYKSGQNQLHQEWEQVDHAVLLVGFGQDEGANYWQLQNSWGTDWGENGYFRMARGIDESGCESIVVAAEVQEEASNSVLDDMLSQI